MTDKSTSDAVSVHIMEKEFLVACKEDEREELVASARYLDQKMREIRDSGKVIGTDRIAVMAALNITHDLLTRDHQQAGVDESYVQRVKRLHDKIENALFHNQQMEF